MKLICVILTYFLLIVGCASKSTYIHPTFEDSNQYFLEKVIGQFDLSKELEGKISQNYNIAVLSIENNTTIDHPIISMIEDQIISSLLQDGYKIVERDRDAIQNFIREGANNYSLTFNKSGENTNSTNVNGEGSEPGINFIKTQLNSAGVIISYRILEAGILYREFPKDSEKQNIKLIVNGESVVINDAGKYEIREAMVRLHIRVHKTSTGEIVHAANLNSTLTDTLRHEFVEQLSSFHYSFFPYEYPLQNRENHSVIKKIKSVTIDSSQNIESSQNQLTIVPRIGYGSNLYTGNLGIFTGGSISYGNNKIGHFGGDLMYTMILPNYHPIISGFYERSVLNIIALKGGVGMNIYEGSLGILAGGGLTFQLGNKFIIKPMAELSSPLALSNKTPMKIGINLNIGILL